MFLPVGRYIRYITFKIINWIISYILFKNNWIKHKPIPHIYQIFKINIPVKKIFTPYMTNSLLQTDESPKSVKKGTKIFVL